MMMMTKMIRITSILLLSLSLVSCHPTVTSTPEKTPDQAPAVVTILTKISSQTPAFVITSVDQSNTTSKQVNPEESKSVASSSSKEEDSPVSPHYEDLLATSKNKEEVEDPGVMTFRTAYKILSKEYSDTNSTGDSSRSSTELEANPSLRIFSRSTSRRRVPILMRGHRARRYRRRRPTHYIPSDVYTIESSARYPPRSLHSNAIYYQKALSYLRDYNKVLKNNRPQGISYRPNAYSDEPSHVRDAYGENTPAVVQDYDTPQSPIDSPHNNPEPRSPSYDQPSRSQSDTRQSDRPRQTDTRPSDSSRKTGNRQSDPPIQQQDESLQDQQQQPLANLQVTDVVPISNANKELVGYLPVIQIPPANDPQFRDVDRPNDSPQQQTQQQQEPEAPQVPSTYLPLLPADADVKGPPQRDRPVPHFGVKGEPSKSGRKGKKKRSGRRSKYLSPSVRSRNSSRRRQRTRGRGGGGRRRQRNNNYRNEQSSYLTSSASSSTSYQDHPHYQDTRSYARQSASSYPRYRNTKEQYDNVYPLFPSSSSSAVTRSQSGSSSSREYPPVRQQQQNHEEWRASWRSGVH